MSCESVKWKEENKQAMCIKVYIHVMFFDKCPICFKPDFLV